MEAELKVIHQGYKPEPISKHILLFNPPVYDTRFPWSNWQQPVGLLQLASLLRGHQCDIRLVDALYTSSEDPLVRHRIRVFSRNNIPINYWRYGTPQSKLLNQLLTLKKQGWQPDDVYLESFTTIWWEGIIESIEVIRKVFPYSRIILYGAYPSLATEMASTSGADIIVSGPIEDLAKFPLDLSFYPDRPKFTHLCVGTTARSSQEFTEEFREKALRPNSKDRIRHFAFADHDVVRRFPEHFKSVLQTVIDNDLKVSFYALGNLYPQDIIDDPELASLLFRAGFKQIVFADDRDTPPTSEGQAMYLESYQRAIEYCIAAGYQQRTGSLAASFCLGHPGEDLDNLTAFITKLAHIAGSLIAVPYQPTPSEFLAYYPGTNLSLELQNGKLFPFAEYNGVSYREYMDVLGLSAIFSAKYRSHSFDFLSSSLIPRLVRSSLVAKSWDPNQFPSEQQNRPVTVGWFNKEGQWVRS